MIWQGVQINGCGTALEVYISNKLISCFHQGSAPESRSITGTRARFCKFPSPLWLTVGYCNYFTPSCSHLRVFIKRFSVLRLSTSDPLAVNNFVGSNKHNSTAMAWPLRFDQADYDRFGVDLYTSLLLDRHGNVCSCPQFWGLFTDPQNVDPSLSAQLSDHLSSGCPYLGTTTHHRHVPSPSGEAMEVATRATMSTSTHTPRLYPMSTAEPHERPSHELKETCIFWYHGNCARGVDCPFEHELNHNWPISRPRGYTHQGYRRCDLKFCPLRTDLVELMQRYYPNGPRVDDIAEVLDVKQEGEEHTTTTLGDKPAGSDSNDMSEDESSTDSDFDADGSEKENDDPIGKFVADNAPVRSSDPAKTEPSSVQTTPLGSPQALNYDEHARHLNAEGSDNEHYEVDPTSAPANEQHPDARLEVDSGPQKKKKMRGKKKNKKTDRGHRALQPGSAGQGKGFISFPAAIPRVAVVSNAPVIPQPAHLKMAATTRSSLTPSPPGPPRISPPPTSIRHAGTQNRKRKASRQSNDVPTKRQHLKITAEQDVLPKTHDVPPKPEAALPIPPTSVRHAGTMYPPKKWIQDFWLDTEKTLMMQERGRAQNPVAMPLVDRITHDQATDAETVPQSPVTLLPAHYAPPKASRVSLADRITYQHKEPKMVRRGGAPLTYPLAQHAATQSPQVPLERRGICFFWYHKGHCRPNPLQDGSAQVCKYLHELVPGEKVTLPPAINAKHLKHDPHCMLKLCPLGSGTAPLEY